MRKISVKLSYTVLLICGIALVWTTATKLIPNEIQHIKGLVQSKELISLKNTSSTSLPDTRINIAKTTTTSQIAHPLSNNHKDLKTAKQTTKHTQQQSELNTNILAIRDTAIYCDTTKAIDNAVTAQTSVKKENIEGADKKNITPKTSVERMKEILSQQEGNYIVFSSQANDFALAESDDGYTLTTPDGKTYEFTASEEGLNLAISSGTVCQFIAESEEYSLGKMTDDAFVIITALGEEYTLKVDALATDIDESTANNDNVVKTRTQVMLDDLLATTDKELLGIFKSMDNNFAMMITDDENHILITPDGSQTSFMPTEKDETLVTSSGTETALVATGNGIAIGNLTDDSYVLLAQSQDDDSVFYEYTLFEENNNEKSIITIASDGTISIETASNDSPDGSSTESDELALSNPSNTSTAIEGDHIASVDPAQETISAFPDDIDNSSIVNQNEEKPFWSLSMAERRIARRNRYNRS